MEINADFSKRVVVHGDEVLWKDSPIAGISRKMFDRIGDEVARATSLVRYDRDSQFSPHVHAGGEEFIVLDGVFQDEHGDFPAGSYVRNPPQSKHTPGSEPGCVIFVKLWQFDQSDRNHVRLDMNKMHATPTHDRPDVSTIPLYHDAREDVRLEIWQPGAQVRLDASEGAELFVLEGSLEQGGNNIRRHSWLRVPMNGKVEAIAGHNGARVWDKNRPLEVRQPTKFHGW